MQCYNSLIVAALGEPGAAAVNAAGVKLLCSLRSGNVMYLQFSISVCCASIIIRWRGGVDVILEAGIRRFLCLWARAICDKADGLVRYDRD